MIQTVQKVKLTHHKGKLVVHVRWPDKLRSRFPRFFRRERHGAEASDSVGHRRRTLDDVAGKSSGARS
jgi:hypothetical protein